LFQCFSHCDSSWTIQRKILVFDWFNFLSFCCRTFCVFFRIFDCLWLFQFGNNFLKSLEGNNESHKDFFEGPHDFAIFRIVIRNFNEMIEWSTKMKFEFWILLFLDILNIFLNHTLNSWDIEIFHPILILSEFFDLVWANVSCLNPIFSFLIN
jgi:hypothetical protein